MRIWTSALLILVIASMAGATAVWLEPGAGVTWNSTLNRYEVMAGTTATINLIADFEVTGIAVGAITVDNTDTAVPTQGVSAVGALHPQLMYHPVGSDPGALKPGDQLNISIFQIRGGVGIDNPGTPEDESQPPLANEVLYNFDIMAGADLSMITVNDLIGPGVGPSDVNPYGPFPLVTTVASIADSGNYDLDPVVIHVIPEPATIALLGIGTLVLLRKRSY